MDDIKEKNESLKIQLEISAKELIIRKDILVEKLNAITFKEQLNHFTSYICKTTIKHNHSLSIVDMIRRNILTYKKLDLNTKVKSLDSYLEQLTNHLIIYNDYFQSRKELNHSGLFSYTDSEIIKQYELFFVSDEKKKQNFKSLDDSKKAQLQEKNNGRPTIYKCFQTVENKKTKEKVTKVITNEDMFFNNHSISFEFTNGVKFTIDIYQNGIYFKDNSTSKNGQLVASKTTIKDGNFKGQIVIPDIAAMLAEDDIGDVQQTNIDTKENDDEDTK